MFKRNQKILHFKMIIYVIRDSIIFGSLGIIFGLLIDLIFSRPKSEESLIQALVLVFVQLIICGIIIYFISLFYESAFGYNADEYIGLTIFTVIFFLVQVQLLDRISEVFDIISSTNIKP